jgi:hypothetical protein
MIALPLPAFPGLRALSRADEIRLTFSQSGPVASQICRVLEGRTSPDVA